MCGTPTVSKTGGGGIVPLHGLDPGIGNAVGARLHLHKNRFDSGNLRVDPTVGTLFIPATVMRLLALAASAAEVGHLSQGRHMEPLHDGDEVRFRRPPNGHWQYGTVRGTNKDGSVNVITDRMTRSLLPNRLEVKRPNRKGKPEWRPVPETTSAPKS